MLNDPTKIQVRNCEFHIAEISIDFDKWGIVELFCGFRARWGFYRSYLSWGYFFSRIKTKKVFSITFWSMFFFVSEQFPAALGNYFFLLQL